MYRDLGAVPTLEQSATGLIKQYFSDINSKDYQDAYNIWKDAPDKPSLSDFEKSYASTLNDTVTVTDAKLQDGENVKVFVTLQATDQLPSGTGTKTTTYSGYYLVGPQNGSFKNPWWTIKLSFYDFDWSGQDKPDNR